MGTHICELLVTFWFHQEVITRQNGYHGPKFKATRGTTQVEVIPLTLFNVLVDNLIWMCMAFTFKYQTVVLEGLGLNVGRFL